jgi:AraC-like DNA-binding protein
VAAEYPRRERSHAEARIGLTRAGIVAPIAACLERLGIAGEQLLGRAGLPGWTLTDPEALIPTSTTARLFRGAARIDGIEDPGLLVGQEARIEMLGTYGQLVRRAPTVGQALEQLVHHHPSFTSSSRMWLVSGGENVEVCHAFTGKFDALERGWQQADRYLLMLILNVVRLGAGATWRPVEVRLQTGGSMARRDAERLSVAPIAFRKPEAMLTVPRALLEAVLPPLPGPALEIPADRLAVWNATAPAHDFVGSIVQVVEMLSWEGYPDIHLTADALGMSVRTLQRQLAAAGSKHGALVGRVRFATAAALLEETDTKVLDIALDLGYSDHAHFTRAFRRWAGCSPQAYRRSFIEAKGGAYRSVRTRSPMEDRDERQGKGQPVAGDDRFSELRG